METGCIIDNSHFSAMNCNLDIIDYARCQGWDGGSFDLDMIYSDFIHIERGTVPDFYNPESFEIDFQETIYYAADQAVEWLNENVVDDGYYYEIDDNSLYLWKVDDATL